MLLKKDIFPDFHNQLVKLKENLEPLVILLPTPDETGKGDRIFQMAEIENLPEGWRAPFLSLAMARAQKAEFTPPRSIQKEIERRLGQNSTEKSPPLIWKNAALHFGAQGVLLKTDSKKDKKGKR